MVQTTQIPRQSCSIAFIAGTFSLTSYRKTLGPHPHPRDKCWISPPRRIRAFTLRTPQCVAVQNSESSETSGTEIVRELSIANPPPPQFGLVAADVIILLLLCSGFALPAVLISQKSERVQRIFGAAFLTITSALYVLRVRSIQRKSHAQLVSANNSATQIGRYLDENNRRVETALLESNQYQEELNDSTVKRFEAFVDRNQRHQDKQHAEVLRAMRGDVDELLAAFEVLQNSIKADEIRRLKDMEAQLRNKEMEIVRLETRLNDTQSTLDRATARESAMKTELDTLRANANESNALRERLLAAQTRAATLEERITRNQESALSPPAQQQQQIPGGKALRDALLNLGKSFPPAGKLLFDPVPDDVKPPPLEPRPLETRNNTLSWPDSALGPSKSDLGLPKDGGFGTDHFARKGDTADDPFSTLRGAFNNEENALLQSESKVIEGKNRLQGTKEKVEESKGSGSTDKYLDTLGKKEPAVKGDENVVEESANNTAEMQEATVKPDPTVEQDEVVDAPQDLVKGDNEQSEEAPEIKAEQESTGAAVTTEVTGVEARVAKVRDIVKRARRSEKDDAERLFASAVELLEATPVRCTTVEAELGAVLLAWARRDIVADGAKGRLQRAVELLRANETGEVARFNLALCLCMLASLETSPRCEELYGEACEVYDTLEDRSRTVCFNAGLAYISRARITSDEQLAKDMYTSAKKQFEDALKVAGEDVKSQTYLSECNLRLSELKT